MLPMDIKEYLATNKRPTRSKWGNIQTEYAGKVFMSKKEADFARSLDSQKKAHKPAERVVSYETQVPFKIVVNGVPICRYILDFKVLYADGHTEHIDVKAFNKRTSKFLSTDTYKLKKKLVLACYGIDILEK